MEKSTELRDHTASLKQHADEYYELAKTYQFDYNALWTKEQQKVRDILQKAKSDFLAANPAYELMEGIVAGVPSLAHYDIDIDAGISAEEGTEDVVSFDLKLPDGKTLEKPGNYFYLAELTLWGTNPEWIIPQIKPDLDGNGQVDFGEVLPDANVLKGISDAFAGISAQLLEDAKKWKPTPSDAFTALVVMIPTMEEYFQAWKESRFVSGDQAESKQFVAVSRLQDITDILAGLQVVYKHVRPMIDKIDANQANQIETDLSGLRTFVSEILTKEKAGNRFTAEDADMLGAEAQNRATAIAGQVTQAAAKLNVKIEV